MLRAAHVRCALGERGEVDPGRRCYDPSPQGMSPLSCSHKPIMASARSSCTRASPGPLGAPACWLCGCLESVAALEHHPGAGGHGDDDGRYSEPGGGGW